MGTYNYNIDSLPLPLRQNRCFVCNERMIPYNSIPGLDAFQYKCENCNRNVIIEISGTLLASSLYNRIRNSAEALLRIQNEIRNCQEERFALTTNLVSDIVSM
jgi:hypothetical protein